MCFLSGPIGSSHQAVLEPSTKGHTGLRRASTGSHPWGRKMKGEEHWGCPWASWGVCSGGTPSGSAAGPGSSWGGGGKVHEALKQLQGRESVTFGRVLSPVCSEPLPLFLAPGSSQSLCEAHALSMLGGVKRRWDSLEVPWAAGEVECSCTVLRFCPLGELQAEQATHSPELCATLGKQ